METANIVTKIKIHALNRVNKYLSDLSLREQQILIIHIIRYYDQLYDLSLSKYEKNSDNILDYISFSLPIAFRYLYKNYNNVEGYPLFPSTLNDMRNIEQFLTICFMAGLMENYEELIQLGILTYEVTGEKSACLSFANKYYSIERTEKSRSVEYSHALMKSFEGYYNNGLSQMLYIILKMEDLVYTWNDNFIGYGADPDVDQFFIRNAQLDFAQATEWDGFSPTAKFGGIEYDLFLNASILIESIAIKHLQFVQVAMKKDPNLESHNILPCIVDYDVVVDSLSYMLEIPEEISARILDTFVFDEENKEYFSQVNAPNPPFIRITSKQLIRSFCGCINRPIDFMLAELKRLYPKDWDRNTQEREKLFRDELYAYFNDDRFITLNRNIDIVENGKILTDVDACIIDKETQEIAFFQLKWQDSIYESIRSLISKRRNYIEKSTKWVHTIEQWIENTSEKRIADFLQLNPQFVCKDKIKIFVIGRHNANFSGDEKPYKNAAWCQWYNLIKIINMYSKENISISKLFDILEKESPYNQKIEYKPSEIKYGNYCIKLVGPTYNQA